MIEEIMPGTKTKMRIIRTIYANSGINLTELIKKTKSSPNSLLEYVNKLRDYGIIREDISKGRKKIHIRRIYPSLKSELSKEIFSFVESDKKNMFFKKYKKLKNYFSQLEELLIKKVEFCLVYGSYARLAAEEESDVDILIVGKLSREEVNKVREIFVTLDRELSLKIETKQQFMKNMQKPLYVSIIKEHAIVFGERKFMDILELAGLF